ncbi:hypothetical protein BpJC4_18200 [Weizmannia acidilactici]|nr:hypothetical protein BpJC4_18200 [Weizmannia acidilactici]
MAVQQLHTVEELEQFVQGSGKRLLFKHSTRCPISAKAHEESRICKRNGYPGGRGVGH